MSVAIAFATFPKAPLPMTFCIVIFSLETSQDRVNMVNGMYSPGISGYTPVSSGENGTELVKGI